MAAPWVPDPADLPAGWLLVQSPLGDAPIAFDPDLNRYYRLYRNHVAVQVSMDEALALLLNRPVVAPAPAPPVRPPPPAVDDTDHGGGPMRSKHLNAVARLAQ